VVDHLHRQMGFLIAICVLCHIVSVLPHAAD
jgi:hypothetical protein